MGSGALRPFCHSGNSLTLLFRKDWKIWTPFGQWSFSRHFNKGCTKRMSIWAKLPLQSQWSHCLNRRQPSFDGSRLKKLSVFGAVQRSFDLLFLPTTLSLPFTRENYSSKAGPSWQKKIFSRRLENERGICMRVIKREVKRRGEEEDGRRMNSEIPPPFAVCPF